MRRCTRRRAATRRVLAPRSARFTPTNCRRVVRSSGNRSWPASPTRPPHPAWHRPPRMSRPIATCAYDIGSSRNVRAGAESPGLLRDAEGEHGLGRVRLPRLQDRRREARLIRRIRIVLRLEAEAGAVPVNVPRLAGDRAVEEIARVELDTRLGGLDLPRAPR